MARVRPDLRRSGQSGFTLVEIMVAIVILLVGVLGVVAMVDAANRSDTTTNGRQNATTLLRRIIETARSVPYRTLKSSNLQATLVAASPDLADSNPSDGSWTVVRAGFTYTLTVSVCVVDDAEDGYGQHNLTDPGYCSDSTQTGSADSQPSDYKRVTAVAQWGAGGSMHTATQVGVVPSNGKGDLPATTAVNIRGPQVITSQGTASATFDVTAVNNPASLSWVVNGAVQGSCPPTTGTCTGSGSAWTFTWNLGTPTIDTNSSSLNYGKCIAPPDGTTFVYDGTYTVGARAYDAANETGDSAATQVTIDRCLPTPPPNFQATERDNTYTGPVDIQWTANPEGDVVGYRVYRMRGNQTLSQATLVCPSSGTTPITDTSCVDPSPPTWTGSTGLDYAVLAVEKDSSGNLKEGAVSYMNVDTGDSAPNAPSNAAAKWKVVTNADGTVTLSWQVPSDPDSGDSVASFRIYRRAATATGSPTYLDRYDYDDILAYCPSTSTGTTCTWTDTNTGGQQHVYNVTAVDQHLRESSPTSNRTG